MNHCSPSARYRLDVGSNFNELALTVVRKKKVKKEKVHRGEWRGEGIRPLSHVAAGWPNTFQQ
jgi:hypothetical protein